MKIRLIRHATLVVTMIGANILVDPMLSEAGAMDPVQNAGNDRRIPLVELPLNKRELLQLLDRIDAVVVTHTHRDHWDARARELLSKNIPVLCQAGDEQAIKDAGFQTVIPVQTATEWRGIEFRRTGGQHGVGEIGQRMGEVSGFVLQAPDEPTLYIAGDTIYSPEVQSALQSYHPDVVVLNAGAAQFLAGGPITMTAQDVAQVARMQTDAKIIAVHMETLNHCQLTRQALKTYLDEQGLGERVLIPQDGETLRL